MVHRSRRNFRSLDGSLDGSPRREPRRELRRERLYRDSFRKVWKRKYPTPGKWFKVGAEWKRSNIPTSIQVHNPPLLAKHTQARPSSNPASPGHSPAWADLTTTRTLIPSRARQQLTCPGRRRFDRHFSGPKNCLVLELLCIRVAAPFVQTRGAGHTTTRPVQRLTPGGRPRCLFLYTDIFFRESSGGGGPQPPF